jgi:hypothetical protein
MKQGIAILKIKEDKERYAAFCGEDRRQMSFNSL